ncbi:unnamed protein product [Moneuplotes crassus]|uniref:Uncharacterized protein n=1 Tax=Euplotes crassus TaxID=5936 RepID=A0AAD1UGC8_EUPCR|nr:unnamed protein product [Moneuplotes crassus]
MKSSQQYKPPLTKITKKDSDVVPFSPSSSRMPPDLKASAEEHKFLDVDSENSFMNSLSKIFTSPALSLNPLLNQKSLTKAWVSKRRNRRKMMLC